MAVICLSVITIASVAAIVLVSWKYLSMLKELVYYSSLDANAQRMIAVAHPNQKSAKMLHNMQKAKAQARAEARGLKGPEDEPKKLKSDRDLPEFVDMGNRRATYDQLNERLPVDA
jgi:hypothetical protein